MGFSRQACWSGSPFPSPSDLLWVGSKGILWHVLLSRLSNLSSCHKLSWMKMAVWFPALSFCIMPEVCVVSFSSHTSWKLLSVDFQTSTPTTRGRSHIVRSASHWARPRDRAPLSLWGSVRLWPHSRDDKMVFTQRRSSAGLCQLDLNHWTPCTVKGPFHDFWMIY